VRNPASTYGIGKKHKDLKISAWIGKFSDTADLLQYVETRYDASGNSTNQFWDDIAISWFDDDFREISILSENNGAEVIR